MIKLDFCKCYIITNQQGGKMKYKNWLSEWLDNYIKPSAKIICER